MTKGQRMKSVDDEIARIDAEIERLKVRREAFVDMKALLSGSPLSPPQPIRKRSANVKPMILDIMTDAGHYGATSMDVTGRVKEKVPNVAKETVGSVLSRLKADGALVYDGDRYYDVRFAPKPPASSPFEGGVRTVN